jgi:hypothetical protein
VVISYDETNTTMACPLEIGDIDFISVGGDCQPAYHIRRLTGVPRSRFFDWIYSEPKSVRTLIKSNFCRILEPTFLEWDFSGTKPKLWDRLNGLQFEHQLKGTDEASVALVRRNYSLLGRHFMEDLKGSRPICFIRRMHEWDGPNAVAETEALAEELLALREDAVFLTLRQKRGREASISGRYIDSFNWQFFESWRGSDALYEKNFGIARSVLSFLEGVELIDKVTLQASPAPRPHPHLDIDGTTLVDSAPANLLKQRSSCLHNT